MKGDDLVGDPGDGPAGPAAEQSSFVPFAAGGLQGGSHHLGIGARGSGAPARSPASRPG